MNLRVEAQHAGRRPHVPTRVIAMYSLAIGFGFMVSIPLTIGLIAVLGL